MALVQCRECGREISDHAIACPQCGHPQRRAAPMSRGIKILLGLMVCILVAMFAIGIFLAWLAPRASYPIEVELPQRSTPSTSWHLDDSAHPAHVSTRVLSS